MPATSTQSAAIRARRAAKQQAGLCTWGACASPLAGRKLCAEHLAQERDAEERRHRVRKRAGLCRCGNERQGGASLCSRCLATVRRLRKLCGGGLCRCGRPSAPDHGQCEACLSAQRIRDARREDTGPACECGNPKVGFAKACERCLDLDGRTRCERELIAALRVLGNATVHAVRLEAGAEERSSAADRRFYRARASLMARGRLSERRLEWIDDRSGYTANEAPVWALTGG